MPTQGSTGEARESAMRAKPKGSDGRSADDGFKESSSNFDSRGEANLRRRRDTLVEYFRKFIGETFDNLHVASAEETNRLRSGLMHLGLSDEELKGWEHYRDTVAEEQRQSAFMLSSQLHAIVNSASNSRYISEKSRDEWIKRLKNPGVGYKQKEYFVQHQMPSYFQAWKNVAEKRKELLKNPAIKELTEKEVRKFGSFLVEKDFLNLHYEKRLGLTAGVEAALRSTGGGRKLHIKAKERLEGAVKARAMSADRVGLWLRHIVEKYPSLAEREQFIDVTLKDYISDWVKVRTEYDFLDARMKKEGVPQGFNRLALPKFLTLSFEQRKSYVEMTKQRLNLQPGGTTPEMENIKYGIRHALDAEEWEDAEELLQKSRKLLQEKKGGEKDRFEIESMERYLRAFRGTNKEKQKETEDARKTLEQMRAIFASDQIPQSLQPLYLAAMNDPDKLAAVAACIYNRVWCREHGYLDDDREKELRVSSVAETRRLAHSKHAKRGLENVMLGAVTDPEQPASVRTYAEGEWAPTIIHMPPGKHDKFLEILESRKTNHAFKYWTTLLPTDVSYEKQYNLAKNVNWVLKSGARKLRKAGLMFSLVGNPPSLN